MKPLASLLCLAWLLLLPGLRAADDSPAKTGGVTLDPAKGEIAQGTLLNISFPTVMVAADKIDAGDQASPFVFEPALEGTFYWKSQTGGEFTVTGGPRPGQEYRVKLAGSLKDLAGKPVAPSGWGAQFASKAFAAGSDFDATEKLSGQPQVEVHFTYPVRLSDAPQHIYFQDRDSSERHPAEVGIYPEEDVGESAPEGSILHVTPLAALPVGRTFDLILDGVTEAKFGQTLPYLRRFPLGATEPLKVEWLGAMNNPLEKPGIHAKFNDRLNPSSVGPDALRVEPPVADLKVRAEDDLLIAEGSFDPKQHYKVTVSPDVRGRRGFALPGAAVWGATFRPKASALFFPGPRIFQRSKLGLKFAFMQVNTGPLHWRLAALPFEKFPAVEARLREFEKTKKNPFSGADMTDPATDNAIPADTTLLVDAFTLPERASGAFPATNGEEEILRQLEWTPPADSPALSGLYLLEISGPAANDPTGKKIVGHRSIVSFSDAIISQKRTGDTVIARVARMSDAQPLAGVKVRAVDKNNHLLAASSTDKNGMASFTFQQLQFGEKEKGGNASHFIADAPDGPAVQFLDTARLGDAYGSDEEKTPADEILRASIFTDRNLYRPGHTVKIKGMVRIADRNDKLSIPTGKTLSWSVGKPYDGGQAASGEAKISADGGWEGEWIVPESAKLGKYRVTCSLDEQEPAGATGGEFSVQEFKTPAFNVKVEDATPGADPASRKAVLRVDSHFFSGQPNYGAKVEWQAVWTRSEASAEEYTSHDEYSEHAAPISWESVPVKGEAKLDRDGLATLTAEAPTTLNAARCRVEWEVTVTSFDGQAISPAEPVVSRVLLQPAMLGIQATTAPGPQRAVKVKLASFDRDDKAQTSPPLRVDLFRVSTKTVKEKVAPFVLRYRNTPLFNPVLTRDVPSSPSGKAEMDLPVPRSGRYVAVVRVPDKPEFRPVSEQIFMGGDEPDEVPVQDEVSLEVHADAEEYTPGQTAAITVRSPFTGMAWVSVETDHILDTLLLPVRGNTGRLDVPIKKEYAPNAHLGIYLVRPGEDNALPAERFANVELKVRQPAWKLTVQPQTTAPKARPGERISGFVQVSNEKTATGGADLTVYAVDDAVLELGRWQPPDLLASFYPERGHGVSTYSALQDYVASIKKESLIQKGFIVGGGDADDDQRTLTQLTRKNFRSLALWQTNLKTNAQGRADFSFVAPDDLTRYRIVAVAQTRASQFGVGSSTVEIAKPLIAEPALPRFLRIGDEVELRAVVRQSALEQDSVTVRCKAGRGLDLIGPAEQSAPARKDLPTVFRFRAKVADVSSVKVNFQAVSASGKAELTDAVEMELPVYPPTILRKESVAGSLPPSNGPQDFTALMPEDWKGGGGTLSATLSTSPYLARLSGLPAILEYPHGCFEQISTRLLVCTMMTELLDYLPADAATTAGYRSIVEKGLKLYAQSQLPDGSLPYWPGGKTANDFVTIQALWSVTRAEAASYDVPEGLTDKLSKAVEKILAKPRPAYGEQSDFLRAFALLVCTREKGGAKPPNDIAAELYRNRVRLGDEGRALLALAMTRFEIMPAERLQLVREIDYPEPPKPRAFDAETFTSPTRAEALMLVALNTAAPEDYLTPKKIGAARERLMALLDRQRQFSTQENFWSLFALVSYQKRDQSAQAKMPNIRPVPSMVSANGVSAAWNGIELARAAGFRLGFPPAAGRTPGKLTYLLRATYRAIDLAADAERRDRGLRVERVVRNLTNPARTGEPGAPVQINDRVLITYRLNAAKRCDYLALEDELPAGLETLNPELKMFAGFYKVPPPSPGARELDLSSSELKDQKTNLYFDRVDAGAGEYSVLAKASAAGSFRWPGTQAAPMYEPMASGLSAGGRIEIASEKP